MKYVAFCIGLVFWFLLPFTAKTQELLNPTWQSVKEHNFINTNWIFHISDDTWYSLTGIKAQKYSAEGKLLWEKSIIGNYISGVQVTAKELVVGNDGSFYCVLTSRLKTIDLSPVVVIDNPEKIEKVIIARYDSTANMLWAKVGDEAYSVRTKYDDNSNIVVDKDNNLYLTSIIIDSVSIDGISVKSTFLPHGKKISQSCIAKIDSSGKVQWVKILDAYTYEKRFGVHVSSKRIKTNKDGTLIGIWALMEADTLVVNSDTITYGYHPNWDKVADNNSLFFILDTSGNIKSFQLSKAQYNGIDNSFIKFEFDYDNNSYILRNDEGNVTGRFVNILKNLASINNKIKTFTIGQNTSYPTTQAYDMVIDSLNNVYLVFNYNGNIKIQKKPKSEVVLQSIASHSVIAKYDSSLNLVWHKEVLTPTIIDKLFLGNDNSIYGLGSNKFKNAGDTLVFDNFRFEAKKKNEEINYIAKLGQCNYEATNTISIKNGIMEVPSTWKNWRWFVDGEELEGVNWFSHSPKKSGTYVVATRLKDGCVVYTKPFVWYVTGIDESSTEKQSINIYPNPTFDSFTVETPKNIKSIEMYSMQGAAIKKFPINSQGVYKITHGQSGIYLIKVATSKNIITKKILIW